VNKNIQVKRGVFLLLVFLYFFLSFLGFFFTSSGWTGFLIYGMGGLIFFVVNYLIFCGLIFGKRIISLACSVKWLVMLIVIQILALLFNMGDYGDNTGSRSFFEVILGRSYWSCHGTNDCSRPPLLGGFAGLLALCGMLFYLIPDVVHNPSYPNLLRNKSFLGSRLFLKASC